MVWKSTAQVCLDLPDLSSAVDIFSALDSSIQPQSIKDCFRLGKFSRDAPRPRPILVKFVRITDVNRIFAKKNGLSSSFSVKPDMSRAQRLLESVLMQERWCLIQSGVSRKSIRLRGDSLYVNHKLHGRVSNSKFVYASAPCGSSQPSSPRSNSPAVEHQQNPDTLVQNTPSHVDSSCSQQYTQGVGVDFSTPSVSPLSPTNVPTQPNTNSSQH